VGMVPREYSAGGKQKLLGTAILKLGLSPTEQKPNYQNQEKDPANPTPQQRSAVIVTAAASKEN